MTVRRCTSAPILALVLLLSLLPPLTPPVQASTFAVDSTLDEQDAVPGGGPAAF